MPSRAWSGVSSEKSSAGIFPLGNLEYVDAMKNPPGVMSRFISASQASCTDLVRCVNTEHDTTTSKVAFSHGLGGYGSMRANRPERRFWLHQAIASPSMSQP